MQSRQFDISRLVPYPIDLFMSLLSSQRLDETGVPVLAVAGMSRPAYHPTAIAQHALARSFHQSHQPWMPVELTRRLDHSLRGEPPVAVAHELRLMAAASRDPTWITPLLVLRSRPSGARAIGIVRSPRVCQACRAQPT